MYVPYSRNNNNAIHGMYVPYSSNNNNAIHSMCIKYMAPMNNDISSPYVVVATKVLTTPHASAWHLNILAMSIPIAKILQQNHDNP